MQGVTQDTKQEQQVQELSEHLYSLDEEEKQLLLKELEFKQYSEAEALHRLTIEYFSPELKGVDWQTPTIHTEWYSLLNDKSTRLQCLVAPVGFAKSSILKSFTVASILKKVDPYALYVSSSFDKTVAQVQGIFKVLKDRFLQYYYKYSIERSNTTECVLQFDSGRRAKVEAVSAGADISGINFEGQRPTLLAIDDIEELDQARSVTRTDNLQDWILTTLVSRLPSLRTGRVRMIGTVFSKNAIANRIQTNYTDSKGQKPFSDWSSYTYKALTDGKSIWEDRHPTEDLLKEKQKNPIVFARNYQNEPLDERGGMVDRTMFRYYTVTDYNFTSIRASFDLASSLKEKADYFAGVVIGKTADGKFYVLDIIRGDKPEDLNNPEAQAQIVVNTWQKFRYWGMDKITFESNQYQSTLKPWTDRLAREQGVYLNLQGVTSSKDKYTRFLPFIPYFTSNSVYFPSGHDRVHLLEQELIAFPEGEHDDLVDALGGCLASFKEFKGVQDTKKTEFFERIR